MKGGDVLILLPLVIVAASAVAAMLAIAVRRSHALTAGIALTGLAVALAATLTGVGQSAGRFQIGHLAAMDNQAVFIIGLILAASLVVGILSYGYLSRRRERPEEYYVLLLLTALGAMVLAISSHFATFFLGLEVLSVALYGLVAYERGRLGVEAGLKYLVLGGTASAFVLFGMALVYFDSGSKEFGIMSWIIRDLVPGRLEIAGWAMILVGVGFKLAVVPFHLWTADVYQGAPAPVTALVATVSKGAVLMLVLRAGYGLATGPLFWFVAAIAVASMFTGNLLALRQQNIKRLLAYSSISHLGYLLITVLVGGAAGATAAGFYLVTYIAATLAAFGVVTVLSGAKDEAESLEDYRGLAWRRPWLAALMTAAMLSLAGIPLTAGFVGKFYLLTAGAGAGLWALVIILVANSGIGLFYYLRVVWVMFERVENPATEEKVAPRIGLATGVVLAGLGAAVVLIGVWPGPLADLVRAWLGGG